MMDRTTCEATGSILDASEATRGYWRVTCGHRECAPRWSVRARTATADVVVDKLREHWRTEHEIGDVLFLFTIPHLSAGSTGIAS